MMGFIFLMMASSTALAFAVEGMLSDDGDKNDGGSDVNTETSTDTETGDLLDETSDETTEDDANEDDEAAGDDDTPEDEDDVIVDDVTAEDEMIVDDEDTETTDGDDEPAEGTHYEMDLDAFGGSPEVEDTMVFDDFDPELDTLTINLPVSTEDDPVYFYEVVDGEFVDAEVFGNGYYNSTPENTYGPDDFWREGYDDALISGDHAILWVEFDYGTYIDSGNFIDGSRLGQLIAVPLLAFTNLDEIPWEAITFVEPASLSGDRTIDGTHGDDDLLGGTGADTINGGAGDDTLRGYEVTVTWDVSGSATLGSDGADEGSQDHLYGGTGDDTLYGHGDDVLDGGSGDDTLFATGAVTMTGGEGADTFQVNEDEDVPVITDFDPSEDGLIINIDLPTINGHSGYSGPHPDYLIRDTDYASGTENWSLVDGAVTTTEIDGDTHIALDGNPLVVLEGVTGLDFSEVEMIGTGQLYFPLYHGELTDVVEPV